MTPHPVQTLATIISPPTSPLILSDRLLTLANEAGRAGYQTTADRLVFLAHNVFDEPPAIRA